MTQIIFQVAAIGCCIYTAYRLGLFIYKKLRKNNKTAKAVQVYINRDSYTYIKRFLSVVSPDTSMSGFISRIIDEHLKKHEKEMSALYTECINKPL